MFGFLKKKSRPPAKRKTASPRALDELVRSSRTSSDLLNSIKEALNQVSTKVSSKEDIDRVLKEIALSKESIVSAIHDLPQEEDIVQLLVSQITEPLKSFLSTRLAAEPVPVRLGGRPAQPTAIHPAPTFQPADQEALDSIVSDMKTKLSMLSQRHLKIINVLAQNRNLWIDYEKIGDQCQPTLTGSCIRGYVSDLIKNYRLPVEKKIVGRQMKVRLSEAAFKKMVMAKLVEE